MLLKHAGDVKLCIGTLFFVVFVFLQFTFYMFSVSAVCHSGSTYIFTKTRYQISDIRYQIQAFHAIKAKLPSKLLLNASYNI